MYITLIFDLVAKLLLIHIQGFPLAEAHLSSTVPPKFLDHVPEGSTAYASANPPEPSGSFDLVDAPMHPSSSSSSTAPTHHSTPSASRRSSPRILHGSTAKQNSTHALNSNSAARRSSPRVLRGSTGSTVHNTTDQNTDILLGQLISLLQRVLSEQLTLQPNELVLSQPNAVSQQSGQAALALPQTQQSSSRSTSRQAPLSQTRASEAYEKPPRRLTSLQSAGIGTVLWLPLVMSALTCLGLVSQP